MRKLNKKELKEIIKNYDIVFVANSHSYREYNIIERMKKNNIKWMMCDGAEYYLINNKFIKKVLKNSPTFWRIEEKKEEVKKENKKKVVNIVLRDHRGDYIMATTSETYEKDLKENMDKLNIWWRCQVEYFDEDKSKNNRLDYPHVHNHLDPRRIIEVNGRYIYATYGIRINDGCKNIYNELLESFNDDFRKTDNEVPHFKYWQAL